MDDFVGLCRGCVHAVVVVHPRGGAPYWRCGLADQDTRFTRYPVLPVIRCAGFQAAPPETP